jgi:hypothetical protein
MRPTQRVRRSTLNNNQENVNNQATTQPAPSPPSTNRRKSDSTTKTNSIINNLNRIKRLDLKKTLNKATVKFNRACKQILKLDQKIKELQNSYTNAIETDRKTFKIVYRMQLATLEGLHEAYIEYIERKMNEIRELKNKLFGSDDNQIVSSNNGSNS